MPWWRVVDKFPVYPLDFWNSQLRVFETDQFAWIPNKMLPYVRCISTHNAGNKFNGAVMKIYAEIISTSTVSLFEDHNSRTTICSINKAFRNNKFVGAWREIELNGTPS